MTLTGLPSNNIKYLIFIVGALGKVEGTVKLFKLHHLLQTEARIKFDAPDEECTMGYTQYAALNTCIEQGLVSETRVPCFIEERRDFRLTSNGLKLFDAISQQMLKSERDRILCVLGKYKNWSGSKLIAFTHKQYIDAFDKSSVFGMTKEYNAAIETIQKIMLDTQPQNVNAYQFTGKLEHVKKILDCASLPETKKVQAGTILSAVRELIEHLTNTAYLSDDTADELFEYVDGYADKENILPSLSSEDFSTLEDEEKKCLTKFLSRVKLPSYS